MSRPFIARCLLVLALCLVSSARAAKRPNVVLILTDDQGYGELACTGNPIIKTPHLDKLYAEGVRLTDFHVNAVCSPSRAALMTGKYASRVGVWHTLGAREIIHREETLMPAVFAASGYRTMMVGKWHNGDNYPFRPEDRGFQQVFRIGGGSPGQVPDYWDNGIFDMHYWTGKGWEPTKGFCTDVQFDAAMRMMDSAGDAPFFCYIATTAPHSPVGAPDEYLAMYADQPKEVQAFYAMCSNIDWNVGRLRRYLVERKLAENTILVFMTDNGSACDKKDTANTYNAGMRGKKGSTYDGGHRVPCFITWPGGGIGGGVDVSRLTAHIDLLPTLAAACDLTLAERLDLDGRSLLPLLRDPQAPWPERTLITEGKVNDRSALYSSAAVLTEQWRLVDKRGELYRIKDDPGQTQNVANAHPEVVQRLQATYQSWHKQLAPIAGETNRIVIGSSHENPSRLNSMDVQPFSGDGRGKTVWNQSAVRKGNRYHGQWHLDVASAGTYRITLRRWPEESGLTFSDVPHKGVAVKYREARLTIGGISETKPVEMKASAVTFSVTLPAGPTSMDAALVDTNGEVTSAYYVEILKR